MLVGAGMDNASAPTKQRVLTGYDLMIESMEALADPYLRHLRGQPLTPEDREHAHRLWKASSNTLIPLLFGLEDIGDLLAVASFSEDSAPDHETVGKVGWLIGELGRLISGALQVQDRAGLLRFPPEMGTPMVKAKNACKPGRAPYS